MQINLIAQAMIHHTYPLQDMADGPCSASRGALALSGGTPLADFDHGIIPAPAVGAHLLQLRTILLAWEWPRCHVNHDEDPHSYMSGPRALVARHQRVRRRPPPWPQMRQCGLQVTVRVFIVYAWKHNNGRLAVPLRCSSHSQIAMQPILQYG